MKPNIKNIEDIKLLVDSFYNKVKKDSIIGYIFNEVIEVNWENHLPKMYRFWETILFNKASFKGNPMLKHILINTKERLKQEHFDRWVVLWNETINENFTGSIAEQAKQRGQSIGQLMHYKIRESEKINEG